MRAGLLFISKNPTIVRTSLFAHDDLHDGVDVDISNLAINVIIGLLQIELVRRRLAVHGIDHLDDVGYIHNTVVVGITIEAGEELEAGLSVAFLIELELGGIHDFAVILVDEQDTPIGLMEKQAAHVTPHLHRAFSIFISRLE